MKDVIAGIVSGLIGAAIVGAYLERKYRTCILILGNVIDQINEDLDRHEDILVEHEEMLEDDDEEEHFGSVASVTKTMSMDEIIKYMVERYADPTKYPGRNFGPWVLTRPEFGDICRAPSCTIMELPGWKELSGYTDAQGISWKRWVYLDLGGSYE